MSKMSSAGVLPARRAAFTVKELTVIGMLASITILLGVTGYGFIPLFYMKATILHVPVIIGAVLAGPRVGMMVGFIFGVFSMFQAVTAPTSVMSIFLNPFVDPRNLITVMVPRILIGLTAYLVYRFMIGGKTLRMALAAICGSMVNTVLFMSCIYIFHAEEFAAAQNMSVDVVWNIVVGICISNGIPEALVAAAITVPVVLAVQKAQKR